MKCVVLVPTRDRPKLLQRALLSFLAAVAEAPIEIVSVVIADDGSDMAAVRNTLETVKRAFPKANFVCLPPETGGARPSGPGKSKNRGLEFIVQSGISHDCVFMFDDDICFSSCIFQGKKFSPDPKSLLHEIISVNSRDKLIVGCRLIGRQDLSTLENLCILTRKRQKKMLFASIEREGVKHVGPQELSGAFLFVPAQASALPKFLPYYNEDYFWLTWMARGGWRLHQSAHALVHAPYDGLEVSFERFRFEQYGEALWGAATANEEDGGYSGKKGRAEVALEERIREIGDIEHIISRYETDQVWSEVAASLERVRSEFETILQDLERGHGTEFVEDLRNVERYLAGKQS